MAEKFQLVTENCLEWATDAPSYDCPKQSPIFSFLGIDWYLYLELRYFCGLRLFKLFVHNVEKKKLLTKEAIVTVSVTKYHKTSLQLYLVSGTASLENEETTVINKLIPNTEGLYPYYGRLTVHCNFLTDLPSELRIHGSKAMHPSNLPALEGQQHISAQNSIVIKTKLAASAPDSSLSGVEKLCFDFRRLLERKSFSDVTLKCGERTFSAHRIILAARSDVFCAMFQNKMAESETGIIDIRDIDSKVFDVLLKYVYTGKIPDISVDIATGLYMAADKYSIKCLKKECSKLMLGKLTKENCLDFLILADACNDKMLKNTLINFIAENLNLNHEAWLEFAEENPQLAVSVYQKYALISRKVLGR